MSVDPKDTQPKSHGPQRNNREYVGAEWESGAGPGGSPKVGGGYEQSKTNGPINTRGLNRRDQRYSLDDVTLQTRRADRAAAEFDGTLALQGSLGMVELRSPSGNNYDLSSSGTNCDCPDKWRLKESGKETVNCKHELIAQGKIAEAGGYSSLPWSCAKLAEYIGIEERTAQGLCSKGVIAATKAHGVWIIDPTGTASLQIAAYISTLIRPDDRPTPPP